MSTDPFTQYLDSVQRTLRTGKATEHSYRPHLKTLIEALATKVEAINEPKRVECGAPDYAVCRREKHGPVTLGYIEAKDIGISLNTELRSDQLKRYLSSLHNLVLTDYLEFRWFVDGDLLMTTHLARVGKQGKLTPETDGLEQTLLLLSAFLDQAPPPITTPRDLAVRMARLTHMIRDMVHTAFEQDHASPLLRDLRDAFERTLIPDLKTAQFADMLAQTMAYGLFAARCNHQGPSPFRRLGAAREIPRTNPLLRQLFETITGAALDDEPFSVFVDDLVQLFGHADMQAVLSHFGRRGARQDPVLHFYETFLSEYDPAVRERRGVYYTPEPVVSYIVRSVDHLLRTRFACPDGLASTERVTVRTKVQEENGVGERTESAPRVLILDPACGTGSFLYGVVDHIRQQFAERRQSGMWSGFVQDQLLPRLFGFELLMAPYAVAHFKLGMQLAAQDISDDKRSKWAYDFSGDERLGVYLTNTLEEAARKADWLFGPFRIISEEAHAAARVKRHLPIMVVLGNPPYSGHSANRSWETVGGKKVLTFIGRLLQDYYFVDGKPLGERNPKWLQDDYVKFIRFAQWRIEQTGAGVLAFITNSSYLDNPTFRGMRQQLLNTFTDIYVLDLHGSTKKKEVCPDGSKDQNVFDIQQGVAISIFVKEPGKEGPAQVHHADLWGLREIKGQGEKGRQECLPHQGKYGWLAQNDLTTTEWSRVEPQSPFYLFVPQDVKLLSEYERATKVTDVLTVNSVGIVTGQDSRVIAFTHHDAANLARTHGVPETKVQPILYRPFDRRFLVYCSTLVTRGRQQVMQHLIHDNMALIVPRRVETSGSWKHALVSSHPVEHVAVSLKTIDTVLPIYVYQTEGASKNNLQQEANVHNWPPGKDGRRPNLNPAFVRDMEQRLGLRFIPDAESVGQTFLSAQDKQGLTITRRSLPHWTLEGSTYFVTFRAAADPLGEEERALVLEHIKSNDAKYYDLFAATVLPDHVHILIRPHSGYSLSRIMKGIKGVSARLLNEKRGSKGRVWQQESWDRIVRDQKELDEKLEYMLNNAVKRGLVDDPWAYDWWYLSDRADRNACPTKTSPDQTGTFTPEDVFHYIYAILHCPTYRTRYAEFLKIDFPRIPLTSDATLFRRLGELGAKLVGLHLLESPALESPDIRYDIPGSNQVEKGFPKYLAPGERDPATGEILRTGRVCLNNAESKEASGQYFDGVPPEVWEFHVGGFQVCQKWLKDRRGRELTFEDCTRYQRIVVAIRETIRLMDEIDKAIPEWPLP